MVDATTQQSSDSQTSSQSSSQSADQSQSATAAAQDAGSQQTQSSQAGTTTAQQTDKVARPDWVPETFFDTEKGEVKGTDLRKHIDELATFKAAEDSRRATLPQTPEAYEAKLPEGFKAPDGIDVKIDVNDPMLKNARELAHAKGWSQSDFSEALGIVAAMKAQEAATYETLKTKNLEGLGTKGPERIDAVTRYLSANFPEAVVKPVLATMATTAHVEMFEAFISKLASQGRTSTFTQTGRDVDTGKVSPEVYEKMSYGEKKAYAERMSGKAD